MYLLSLYKNEDLPIQTGSWGFANQLRFLLWSKIAAKSLEGKILAARILKGWDSLVNKVQPPELEIRRRVLSAISLASSLEKKWMPLGSVDTLSKLVLV